jgi:hypothetical protein
VAKWISVSRRLTDNGSHAHWDVFIESISGPEVGPWTLLIVREYSGDDLPQYLYFEKGHERLIKQILSRLALDCGPLALFANGEDPQVIDG